ncbi:hypothetical protein L195_g061450 [Trifolium pratense]|uniref:Uncharacterized protein n=1 Tax=Trifolium pratense TaxID=57577 RepID=A0A2K3K9X0_TRIPR|nr:hypothetical protein L195_g061450 [Trifolium pratense]
MERTRIGSLGEDISNLRSSWNGQELHKTFIHFETNNVTVNVQVLRSLMKGSIGSNVHC